MKFITKLVVSNFTAHKIRAALTIAAIAFSVSLVVATTSGYLSIEETAKRFLTRYMGTADAQITRKNDPHGGVPETLIDQLATDPDVRGAVGRLEAQAGLIGQTKIGHSTPAQIVGIRRPQDKRVESMPMIAGQWFETEDGDVAVIDQMAAELRHIDIGGSFDIPGVDKKLRVKVVGIVQKPALLAAQMQSIYLPLRTLQKFIMPDKPGLVTRVMIDLKPQADSNAFAERWRAKLAAIDPTLKLSLAGDTRKQLDQNFQGVRALSYLGGTVSMLAALFIVFSALSMGVSERSRTLAMLRAVGAQRSQLGKLVVVEGFLLAIVGVVIGVPLGWVWLKLLSLRFDEMFATGVKLSPGGIAFAGVGSIFAALVASFLPAWTAMRVSPLEAMAPLTRTSSPKVLRILVAIAIVLCAVDPILLFSPWERWVGDPERVRVVKFYGHFFIGLPGVMIGYFLLAPLIVRAVEVSIGPPLAKLFGLRFAMIRQQVSSASWRAAGTCAALMVGLAILFVLQTQGRSMIGGWKLPDKFPDMFIVSPLGALDVEQQKKLAATQGIRNHELLSIVVVSPGLGSGFLAIAGTAFLPESTLFFGVDPDKAQQMLDLDFRGNDGSDDKNTKEQLARDAWAKLREGRHVIITEEFRQLKGLKIGDSIELKTPVNGPVKYTIAGIVWSPGMDVFVSLFDMSRQLDERTAGSVFGTSADAKRDFGVDETNFFAANLESGVDKEVLLKQVQRSVRKMGMKAGDVRQIKAGIQDGFQRLLLLASTVAFAAMAVSSLGVTNTIMASIRSRRWQFGVLRSVGFTRSQLLRLVLAEATLIGIVGVVMGLIAGMEMSINAREFSRIVIGYMPPMTIPWGIISIGAGLVMLVAILASLWPAVSVAKTEPLTLLQAGRAAS